MTCVASVAWPAGRHAVRAALLLSSLAFAPQANALCTLVCSCSVSATAVNFGTVNPLALAPTDSTGTVTVSCGGVAGLLIPYKIDLGKGLTGSYASRRLTSGGNAMLYNLYLDTNRATVWGDGSTGTQSVNGGFTLDVLGLAAPQVTTLYGRIPGAQISTRPGTYADTVGVTLTYY